MNDKIKKRILRTALFSVLALVIGAGVAWMQIKIESARVIKPSEEMNSVAIPVAGLQVGGPYSLTDHNGNSVNEKTYAGKYKLIYFGFTYCPAICPTELGKMRQALNGLPNDIAEKIQPIFITIDPERDTVDVLKNYVTLFHPRLVALTGTVPQVELAKKAYRVYGEKARDESANDYTMDHSSFTYLMGPNDELVSMYKVDDSADFMAKDMAEKIQ